MTTDEGQGLSGRSLATVSRALNGIGPDRQRFPPSHAGEPGPAAGENVRGSIS